MAKKKRIRKFFAPKHTEGEKFLLKMQKQKITVQAFYIALAIAFASALVKLLVLRATAFEILAEELIIFVPFFYIAVRRVNADLASAKKVNVKESFTVLTFCAALAGLVSFALSFVGLLVFAKISAVALDFINITMVAGAIGVLVGVIFYALFYMLANKENNSAEPPAA